MASIEERPHRGGTTWRVVWWEPGRKRQTVTFRDAGEAVKFRQLVEGSGNNWPAGWQRPLKAAPPVKDGPLTFGQWAARAIDARPRANERTKADYRRDLKKHFMPTLGPIPLAELTGEDIARWLADREAAGLSDKTIRNLHGFASSIFVDALIQHPPLVTHNPFASRLRKRASVRTEEMCFLTPQEFATVLSRVREEYQSLIRFLAGTGARYGEATALQVRDVDLLGRKTVTITKAWKRTDSSSWVVGEPKTQGSRRTLSLSGELVDLLVPLTAGRRGDELLFAGARGLRLPHAEVYKRGWAPAVARARVCDQHFKPQRDGRGNPPRLPKPCDCAGVLDKKPRIHDLRHSHVSWLIADGLPLPAISRRVGHSSINITIDRYGHLDPALDAAVNAAVDRALARR